VAHVRTVRPIPWRPARLAPVRPVRRMDVAPPSRKTTGSRSGKESAKAVTATFEDVANAGRELGQEGSESRSATHHVILRGPFRMEAALACGAHAASSSVLLRPTKLDEDLVRSVYCLLPNALFPLRFDTKESLARRLSQCDFLDAIVVLAGGNGRMGSSVQLNVTTYSQPRRVSWSVSTSSGTDGQDCGALLQYPHAYHRSQHSTPMPMPVFDLGVELWRVAWPFLTGLCQQYPMNHCELLCYYTLFNSHIGRHRDNFTARHLTEYYASGKDPRAGPIKGPQVPGSSVLIWTIGNAPMTLSLSFPASAAGAQATKQYVLHPELSFELCGGTLFVFATLDDLFFCHECRFSKQPSGFDGPLGADGHRFSLVYRWLRWPARTFTDTNTAATTSSSRRT
jgi:hypothetical protein